MLSINQLTAHNLLPAAKYCPASAPIQVGLAPSILRLLLKIPSSAQQEGHTFHFPDGQYPQDKAKVCI